MEIMNTMGCSINRMVVAGYGYIRYDALVPKYRGPKFCT